MVALIHNQVAIIAHEIVEETVSYHALYHGYIKQAGCLCAAATDPAIMRAGIPRKVERRSIH